MGVAERVGTIMTFWALSIFGILILRSTIIKIAPGELQDINVKAIIDDYNKTITSKLSNISKYIIPSDTSIPLRKIEQTSHILDIWDGDINMIPYKPTSEKNAME